MADVLDRPLDARVAPACILSGHSDGQVGDNFHHPSSTRGSSLVGPFLGDELSVPTKDGVGSDERSDFGKGAAADSFAAHGEPSALSVGQTESLATELLLEDSVLLSEIVDDRVLLAGDPASQGGDENLPGLENDGHPLIVACGPSIRQLSLATQVELFFPGICSAEYLDPTAIALGLLRPSLRDQI